jgi:negative regulator of flagellin synthesis FlgM
MAIDFIGVGGSGQIGSIKKTQAQKTSKTDESEDKVQFASVLQDASKLQSSTSTSEDSRAEKVSALKAQVQSGSYEPDLQKVSASLLQFLVEGE